MLIEQTTNQSERRYPEIEYSRAITMVQEALQMTEAQQVNIAVGQLLSVGEKTYRVVADRD
jgi:hypothetical protein